MVKRFAGFGCEHANASLQPSLQLVIKRWPFGYKPASKRVRRVVRTQNAVCPIGLLVPLQPTRPHTPEKDRFCIDHKRCPAALQIRLKVDRLNKIRPAQSPCDLFSLCVLVKS